MLAGETSEDLGTLAGRPLRLRFEWASGSLFSFWVSRTDCGESNGFAAAGGPGLPLGVDSKGHCDRAKSDDRAAVRISNVRPRRTVDGSIVNAHDGMFQPLPFPDGRYWLFGTHYHNCTDFSACTFPCAWENNTCMWLSFLSCGNALQTSDSAPRSDAAYSSATLGMDDWRLESADILPAVHIDNSKTFYFEPNVLYDNVTEKYVLSWCHGGNCAGPGKSLNIPIAVASQPQGPYTPATPWKTRHNAGSTQGTWRDPDTGIAYVRYNSNHGNCIEELSPDLLSTTGRFTCTGAYGEGGGMFKRQNKFYLMTALGCCFCPAGGDAEVWVSTNGPLGNYSFSSNANPNLKPPTPPPLKLDGGGAQQGHGPLCDLGGVWAAYTVGPPAKWSMNLTAKQTGSAVSFFDGPYPVNGTVRTDGTVSFPTEGIATIAAYNSSAPPCTKLTFGDVSKPSGVWAKSPWLRFPDFSHPSYRVPAQQFGVLSLPLANGSTEHLFFGERWPDSNASGLNAPPDGTKASGWQALVPLEFSDDGEVLPMQPFSTRWAEFTVDLASTAATALKSDDAGQIRWITNRYLYIGNAAWLKAHKQLLGGTIPCCAGFGVNETVRP